MRGFIIGDVVGSVYAFKPIKTKKFEFFDINGHFTDDTVLAAGVNNVLKAYYASGKKLDFKAALQEELLRISWEYQDKEDIAYSRFFSQWMFDDEPKPYGSAGIIAATRSVPVGFMAESLEEAEDLGVKQAEITHNHAEGLKGAKCMAGCVFLAKSGKSKEEVLAYAKQYYPFQFDYLGLLQQYNYIPTCPMAMEPSIFCYVISKDFEDAIRNVIGIGGADSMAAITGALAEATYGVPDNLADQLDAYLDDEIRAAFDK